MTIAPGIELTVVDAFADAPFAGNPAAVCRLGAWLDDDVMQAIAAEHNLSETAFVVARDEPLDFDLRWFTPTIEVELCGHATLATAHVLFEAGAVPGGLVAFETRSGRLVVEQRDDGRLAMDLPSRPAVPCATPPGLIDALGAAPLEIGQAKEDYLCAYARAADVAALTPDVRAIGALGVRGVIATAPGDAPDTDFVSRFFAPGSGVDEDPVTGSAHCTLAPYWAERLDRTTLRAHQISKRGGRLECTVEGDRVRLVGRAVTYLRGVIVAPMS